MSKTLSLRTPLSAVALGVLLAAGGCAEDPSSGAGGAGSSSSSSSGAPGGPPKSLVLVGGGLSASNKAVYARMVDLAGGPGKAKIGVIAASAYPYAWDDPATRDDPNSDNSKQNALYYAGLFTGTYGAADAQVIPIDVASVDRNDDEDVIALSTR